MTWDELAEVIGRMTAEERAKQAYYLESYPAAYAVRTFTVQHADRDMVWYSDGADGEVVLRDGDAYLG